MPTKGRFLLALPLVLLLVSGCKRPGASAQIHGKVTYRGNPVTGGTLTFITKEAGGYTVPIDPKGNYSARDLPYGEMVVTVETESAKPKPSANAYGQRYGQGGSRGGAGTKKPKQQLTSPTPQDAPQAEKGVYVQIPIKYARKDTTTLKVTITSSNQEEDFELTP